MSGKISDQPLISNSSDLFDIAILEEWQEEHEWQDIRRAAESNKTLQKAIDRVKILYYLSKKDGNS